MMRVSKKWPVLGLVFVIIIAAVLFGLSRLNRYQQEGALTLPGLKEAVTVLRDEKGMAYIYAKNPDDAIMAMGFVTAQDRLFQMELTRLFATGKISEMIGEKGEPLDTRMRTIGLHRLGKRHAGILEAQTKIFTQKYIDGINAYIKNGSNEHPLEFSLAGIKPGLWDLPDVLAIMYLMSWNSAANIETEIIAQMLTEKVGLEKAKEMFPLNINPDDLPPGTTLSKTHAHVSSGINLASDQSLLAYLQDRPLHIGSNNWTTGPRFSPGGKPILANDPHLDSRILPGPWFPCGIITPEFWMVGVSIPGIPIIVVGRNEHIAIGVTNAYGDAQDLYIETLDPKDPNRYLEGDKSLPFEVLSEKLFIKDKDAPGGKKEKEIKIRLTRRGPVISGVLPGFKTEKVVTLRWAPFETMGPHLGTEQLMSARSIEDVRKALSKFDIMMLNFVFADKEGNIGWMASGKLPSARKVTGLCPTS